MIYTLWQLYAETVDKSLTKSLQTKDTDAQRFDNQRKVTWNMLEGVMNNDSRSMNDFYRIISEYLKAKAYSQIKQWGMPHRYDDIPDLVNGFLVEKILTKREKFWTYFFKNPEIQKSREKGMNTVPFARAITGPYVNYMRDQLFRGSENKHPSESLDEWLDLTDPMNNPFTHMNKTQQERRLHAELIRLFNAFIKRSRSGPLIAMEGLLYQILFEDNSYGDIKKLLAEYMASDARIRQYVKDQGGDIDTDYSSWVAKFYRDLRTGLTHFKNYLSENLDPQFAQLACKAYVRRIARDSLDELKVIAKFMRIAKWVPPQTYIEYGYKPTYEDVKAQSYMQIDLAVSYSAVVYETLKYMRATGFDKKLVAESEFYQYASKAGFPLENGRIPRIYLSYLIHKYRHLFHPSLDLEHPENFTAMAVLQAPEPIVGRSLHKAATHSIRLMADVRGLKAFAGPSDKEVRKLVVENIGGLTAYDLESAYIQAVKNKFKFDTGYSLDHRRGDFYIREFNFTVRDTVPYSYILNQFQQLEQASPLSKTEMKEKTEFSLHTQSFSITGPGKLRTYGNFPIFYVIVMLDYAVHKKFRPDRKNELHIVERYGLKNPGYRKIPIPELGNIEISYFNNGNVTITNIKKSIWDNFVRLYELASAR